MGISREDSLAFEDARREIITGLVDSRDFRADYPGSYSRHADRGCYVEVRKRSLFKQVMVQVGKQTKCSGVTIHSSRTRQEVLNWTEATEMSQQFSRPAHQAFKDEMQHTHKPHFVGMSGKSS